MKTAINFYQIDSDEGFAKSVAPLLLKILEEKINALILVKNNRLLKELDDGLWSYGRNKFIPHVIVGEKDFNHIPLQRQPILLSSAEKNDNGAKYLLLFEACDLDFLSKFEKVFYFHESQNLDTAKNFASSAKSKADKISFYRKVEGKWEKN